MSCLGGILSLAMLQNHIIFEHARHCAFVSMYDGGTEISMNPTAGLDMHTSFAMP
jgi:hypothetical protein